MFCEWEVYAVSEDILLSERDGAGIVTVLLEFREASASRVAKMYIRKKDNKL